MSDPAPAPSVAALSEVKPSPWLYQFGRWLCFIFMMLFFRPRGYGASRVPAAGPVLLAANHQSYLDPPLIGGFLFPRPLWFVARMGLFRFGPFGRLIARVNAVPINDEGSDAAGVRKILELLGEGRAVLIFPEGNRSPDGTIHEFKRGVWLLLKRAKCPVVPVAVEGCYEAWPRHRRLPVPNRKKIAVLYGEPIGHDELTALGPEEGLRLLQRRVEELRAILREEIDRDGR